MKNAYPHIEWTADSCPYYNGERTGLATTLTSNHHRTIPTWEFVVNQSDFHSVVDVWR